MGYVSEVVIGVPTKYADVIREYELFDEEYVFDQDTVMFYNSWIKWGRGPDSENIERLITDLLEQGKEAFMYRLGEESGDVEEIGEPWKWDIYTNQSINKPF